MRLKDYMNNYKFYNEENKKLNDKIEKLSEQIKTYDNILTHNINTITITTVELSAGITKVTNELNKWKI